MKRVLILLPLLLSACVVNISNPGQLFPSSDPAVVFSSEIQHTAIAVTPRPTTTPSPIVSEEPMPSPSLTPTMAPSVEPTPTPKPTPHSMTFLRGSLHDGQVIHFLPEYYPDLLLTIKGEAVSSGVDSEVRMNYSQGSGWGDLHIGVKFTDDSVTLIFIDWGSSIS